MYALACGEEHERRFGIPQEPIAFTYTEHRHAWLYPMPIGATTPMYADEYKLNYDIHKSDASCDGITIMSRVELSSVYINITVVPQVD